MGNGSSLVHESVIDRLVARELLRNSRRWGRHSRNSRFLVPIEVPRSLRLDPFVNLFAGGERKIDEAHAGAFFSLSNPVDFPGCFDNFERARKLKTEK